MTKFVVLASLGLTRVLKEHPEEALSILIYFFVSISVLGILSAVGFRRAINVFQNVTNNFLKILRITFGLTYGFAVIFWFVGVIIITITGNAALISLIFGLPVFYLFGFL